MSRLSRVGMVGGITILTRALSFSVDQDVVNSNAFGSEIASVRL